MAASRAISAVAEPLVSILIIFIGMYLCVHHSSTLWLCSTFRGLLVDLLLTLIIK